MSFVCQSKRHFSYFKSISQIVRFFTFMVEKFTKMCYIKFNKQKFVGGKEYGTICITLRIPNT